jgi:hypothetical protein
VSPKDISGLTESDWRDLLETIDEGACTPFLGAGANSGILPLGEDLAKEWATEYKFPFPDKIDLPQVSQYVAITKDNPLWPKQQLLRSFRKQASNLNFSDALKPESPLSVLSELPFAVYMTTNYDDFLHQALRLKGKAPQLELCRWNPTVRERFESAFKNRAFVATTSTPVVFHLHGYQSDPQSIVLTEDDYYSFLTKMSELKLPPRIEEAWNGSSLLFIGYRLADLSFNVLFRMSFRNIDRSNRFSSLAVQLPPEDNEPAKEYLGKYFSKSLIKIYWGDATEFATELRERWTRHKGLRKQKA